MRLRWPYFLALTAALVGAIGIWAVPRAASAWERHRDAVQASHLSRDLPLVLADANGIQRPAGSSPRRCGSTPDFTHVIACYRFDGSPRQLLPAMVAALRAAGFSHIQTRCNTLPAPGSLVLTSCGAEAQDRSYGVGLTAGTHMEFDKTQRRPRAYADGTDGAIVVSPT